MKSIFTMYGAKLVGVPLESDGINIDILRAYVRRYQPKLLYTMPIYQTPTGITMSPEKRQALLALAEQHDFYIIEDDLFSDLNLDDQPVLPLKSEDINDRVIYIKSFSKLLMPGIRTSFVVMPKRLHDQIINTKYATDLANSGFLQRALASFIVHGEFQQHVQTLSQCYRQQYQLVKNILSEWKGVEVIWPRGGFGLWLTLPEPMIDDEIYYYCKMHNVIVAPGHTFYLSPILGSNRHLRIGFASSNKMIEGLNVLAQALNRKV
jgi:DNA-binding transcriptional MocR family regulator